MQYSEQKDEKGRVQERVPSAFEFKCLSVGMYTLEQVQRGGGGRFGQGPQRRARWHRIHRQRAREAAHTGQRRFSEQFRTEMADMLIGKRVYGRRHEKLCSQIILHVILNVHQSDVCHYR